MVPYFGSNLRTVKALANTNEGLLDSYTGSGSQISIKKEQSPLFKPDENVHWAYGTPNQNNFIQSRINPSMKMANVKPFEEERVAPGLGDGSDGFNSGMMNRDTWMPKTVDDLRVLTNPRAGGVSLIGHEGPANGITQTAPTAESMGAFEKNRPDTDFEMTKDRYLTTTGLEKGPALHSIPIDTVSYTHLRAHET